MKFLPVEQVAAMLGKSPSTIYRGIERKEIPFIEVQKTVKRVPWDETNECIGQVKQIAN